MKIVCRPKPAELPNIYTTLGLDYDERVLPSITNEVLKAVVAEFDAGELITQRENLSARVKSDLVMRAEQFGVVLDDIAITHLTFGRDFTHSVEMKQVAQQDAEKARLVSDLLVILVVIIFFFVRFLVEKAEQVKQAAIINAEGDSEAALLLAKAFEATGEGLVELRRIETAEDVAASMAASRNVVYLPSDQSTLLSLPQ